MIILKQGAESINLTFDKDNFSNGKGTIEIKDVPNAKYLYYLFNTINWKKYDESTGVPSLSAKTIERIKVTLSMNSSEQHLISKFLSKFDDKIRREESLLNYLQTYKKGLLQQLFI